MWKKRVRAAEKLKGRGNEDRNKYIDKYFQKVYDLRKDEAVTV